MKRATHFKIESKQGNPMDNLKRWRVVTIDGFRYLRRRDPVRRSCVYGLYTGDCG